MKKITLFLLSIVAITTFLSSCNDAKTTQELIQEEKKSIQRFVAKNNIKTLSNYPADGKFAENEYYRDPDGLYVHVVDSGNGKRVKFGDEICVRFDGVQWFKSDTVSYDSYTANGNQPFTFTYGNSLSYDASFACSGWAIPLSYVTEGAIIDLIIPSNLGSNYDNKYVRPVFYKRLQYTRFSPY